MSRRSTPSAVEHWFACGALADFRSQHCADLLLPQPVAAAARANTAEEAPAAAAPAWGPRLLWTMPGRMSAVLLRYARCIAEGAMQLDAMPGAVQGAAPPPPLHPAAEAAAGAEDEDADDLAAFAH
jgi:hypothetical protein